MGPESFNDPLSFGLHKVELIVEILEEVPLTLENKRIVIGGALTDHIEKELNTLKQKFKAKQIRLIAPETTYIIMLQESLENAINQLEAYEDWPTYQTESIEFLTDKLIQLAFQKSLVRPLETVVKFKHAPAGSVKIGTWIAFMDSISDEQKAVEEAYVLGQFIKWLVDQIKENNRLTQAPTLTNAIEPASSQEDEKPKVPTIALMLVYLEKIGYFNAGTTRQMIHQEEAAKYDVSPNSLYNNFRYYKDEKNRRKESVVPHIEKAIGLLDDWGTAIGYAQADLSYIKENKSTD